MDTFLLEGKNENGELNKRNQYAFNCQNTGISCMFNLSMLYRTRGTMTLVDPSEVKYSKLYGMHHLLLGFPCFGS